MIRDRVCSVYSALGERSRLQAHPNSSSIRANRPPAIVGPSPVPGRVFPSDPKESQSVLRSRVKAFSAFGDLLFCMRRGPTKGRGEWLPRSFDGGRPRILPALGTERLRFL